METLRETTQTILPVKKQKCGDYSYDLYPTHDLGEGTVYVGYGSLAERLIEEKLALVDGYQGVRFDLFVAGLKDELEKAGKSIRLIDVSIFLKPTEEIEKMVAPYLGGDDPLFGFRTSLELRDFFDGARMESVKNMSDFDGMTVIYGPGAFLTGLEGLKLYVDIPKNEIQFRNRAGSITNLGADAPEHHKKMYKRCYFVDWVVLNRHKKAFLPDIDIFVDGQREDTITWAEGDCVRAGLDGMAKNAFRVRPWFEPGAWGGTWIKEHIPDLSREAKNYAWSFELIVPENGLIFSGDGNMLEISFDFLMYRGGEKVVGKDCYAEYKDEFPIRMDYLDTFDGRNLSVQCHPQLSFIKSRFGEVLTQEETYYILDTKDNASVYLGFKEGVDKDSFRDALNDSYRNGTELDVNKYINSETAHKHDLFLIPPGTLHSAGNNNMVLEISTTPYIFTFKMYDWLSLDLDGKPRPLNIDRAMDNLCFDRQGDVVKRELVCHPSVIDHGEDWVLEHLPTHKNHSYDVHRYTFSSWIRRDTDGKCNVINLVEGSRAEVRTANGGHYVITYGETLVVSAGAGSYEVINESGNDEKIVVAFMK